jgi:hypothetical protein
MITFKQYLEEAAVVKWEAQPLAIKQAIELLNLEYRDGLKAITTGGVLFRGDWKLNKTKISVIDTTNSRRTSKDTTNLYQLMMDISPSLKGFHSRSNSLICSSNSDTARQYAKSNATFIIVPIDGTIITVSSQEDFGQNQFINGNGLFKSLDLSYFDARLCLFLDYLGMRTPKKFTNAAEIDDFLSRVDPDKFTKSWCLTFKSATEEAVKNFYVKNQAKVFSALAANLMTPKSLELKNVQFGKKLPEDVECWFSGKAIAIPFGMFNSMLVQLNKSGFKINRSYKNEL